MQIKVVLFLLFSFLLFHCDSAVKAEKMPQKARKVNVKPVPVAVIQPQIGPAFDFYATTASLEPEYRAEIRAKASGVIQELRVEEGQLVQKGDVLIVLENSDQLLELKQAQIRLDQAKIEFERNQVLHQKGILADELFDQSSNALKTAEAEVELAELKLSYTQVMCPLDGTLVKRLVDLGAHIDSGTILFEIMDMSPMLLRIHVPANRMNAIKVGQKIDLVCDSNQMEIKGTISLISPVVDPTTGTIKITATIEDAPTGVRPGEFVHARLITAEKKEAMLVPAIAVFEEKGQKILYVVNNGKAERRNVQLGLASGEKVEIKQGIQASDLVVVKGQRELKEGLAVQILEGPKTGNSVAKEGTSLD